MTKGQQRLEWEQWRTICGRLRAMDVVTEDDLRAPVHADKTPGQILLNDLRIWGDLRAKQGYAAD